MKSCSLIYGRSDTKSESMKTCVLALTAEGKKMAGRIAENLEGCTLFSTEMKAANALSHLWKRYDGIICVMATGIVVRSIAPLVADKTIDPCVVVVDQRGEFAISLLSGHLGGGNRLAERVAAVTGGRAVITTASDVMGRTALDLWAKRHNLHVPDRKKLTETSARLVNGSTLTVYSTLPLVSLPADFSRSLDPDLADIVISYNKHMTSNSLCCIPETLFLGLGCNRDTSLADIELSFSELCRVHNLNALAFAGMASIDLKSDEQGILQFAEKHGVKMSFFSRDELNGVKDVSFSPVVMKSVGAQGVAEPAALLAACADGSEAELIIAKMKWKDVTLAVAERKKSAWD